MGKPVYVGHICNDFADFKTLVIAETPEKAMAKILEKFNRGTGYPYRESDITLTPFHP